MGVHIESDTRGSGLTRAQLKKLRLRLVHVREDALARLANEEETARATESLTEPMDAAELAREQGDAAEQSERTRALLREVDDALARLDSGTYGLSQLTGRPIGFARLAAIPWARYAADEDS
jgi:DnaK suppressor protein